MAKLKIIKQKENTKKKYRDKDIFKVIEEWLRWASHTWRNQNLLLRGVMEQNPVEKRPLGRPRMLQDDVV